MPVGLILMPFLRDFTELAEDWPGDGTSLVLDAVMEAAVVSGDLPGSTKGQTDQLRSEIIIVQYGSRTFGNACLGLFVTSVGHSPGRWLLSSPHCFQVVALIVRDFASLSRRIQFRFSD